MRAHSEVTHTGDPYAIPYDQGRRRMHLCTADLEDCAACREALVAFVAFLLDFDVEQALLRRPEAFIGRDLVTYEQALEMRRLLVLHCMRAQPAWNPLLLGTRLEDLVVVDSVGPACEAVPA